MSWLVVLGAFMLVGWVAERWARSATSPAMQYLGLGLYVVAEAIIMVPLLYVAAHYAKDPNIIPTAGLLTGLIFTGLTGTVFLTRHDFSWLRRRWSLLPSQPSASSLHRFCSASRWGCCSPP